MTPTQFDSIVTRLDAILAALATTAADNQPTSASEPSSDLPEAPEGFHHAVIGPLKVEAHGRQCNDVATHFSGGWETGYYGDSKRIYSIRKGSQIAKLNNLE